MSFGEILREISGSVTGALGAMIVGMDGITVDEYSVSGVTDLQTIGIEYGAVMKEVENVSSSLELGKAREMAVTTEGCVIIIRMITEEYFLILVLSPGSNLGKGRFKARVAANRIAAEF